MPDRRRARAVAVGTEGPICRGTAPRGSGFGMNAPPIEAWRGRSLDVELRAFPLPDELADDDLAQLTDAERARAAGFSALRRRIEYVTARAHMRRTLGTVLGTAPQSIHIVADDFGKPQHSG